MIQTAWETGTGAVVRDKLLATIDVCTRANQINPEPNPDWQIEEQHLRQLANLIDHAGGG